MILDREPVEADYDRLFENGCDDAAFATDRGIAIADFDRESETMSDAIATAVAEVEAAGLTPMRIVDHDLVTLADIADRIDQSRESVRRYTIGERGPGRFPPPINAGREGATFYRWSEVAPWLREALGIEAPEEDPALAMANLLLQARQMKDRVPHSAALGRLLTTQLD